MPKSKAAFESGPSRFERVGIALRQGCEFVGRLQHCDLADQADVFSQMHTFLITSLREPAPKISCSCERRTADLSERIWRIWRDERFVLADCKAAIWPIE